MAAAVAGELQIGFDKASTQRDGLLEGGQRIFWSMPRSPAMTDDEHCATLLFRDYRANTNFLQQECMEDGLFLQIQNDSADEAGTILSRQWKIPAPFACAIHPMA